MLAANPTLLLDLNTQPNPSGLYSLIGEVRSFEAIGFVEIESAAEGRELWRTDGTAAGTFLLQDINPGTASSSIGEIVDVAGLQYFNVFGDVSGLYRTDGTSAGTYQLLPTIAESMTALGSTLIFATDDPDHGIELWMSNGTVLGTALLKDINLGIANSGIQSITAVGNRLLFQATTQNEGAELWETDGTENGTQLVEDIVVGSDGSYATVAAAVGDGAIVNTIDGGFRYYVSSSGTLGSTLPFPAFPYANSYRNLGNSLVFIGLDSNGGTAIWRTDGTPQGTESLVTNPTSNPYGINVIGSSESTVYLSVPSGSNTADLYAVSTQGPAVKLLGDGNTVGYTISDASLTKVLIETINLDFTNQFTISDGTLAGTISLVANPDVFASGGLFNSAVQGSRVYFSGRSSTTGTSHPWVFDFGSQQFTSLANIPNTFDQRDFKVINGGVAWLAEDADGKRFQFSFDGATATDASSLFATFARVAVVNGSAIVAGVVSQGATLIALNQGVSSTLVAPTAASTLGTYSLTWPISPFDISGQTFFIADYDGIRTLWRTDGTSAGTIPLIEATAGNVDSLFELNNKAYLYQASYGGTNSELLSSDGSVASTTSESFSVRGQFLGVAGDNFLVFRNGTLFASDGTNAGTQPVALIPNSNFGVTVAFELDNAIYFTAYDNNSHRTLWKSDGTSTGTLVVNVSVPSERYHNAGTSILIADSNGKISESLDALASQQLIGAVSPNIRQLISVANIVYVVSYNFEQQLFRVERPEREGLPATVVGTFDGEVALLELAGKLVVVVNGGVDTGIWVEAAGGLIRDPQLSSYRLNGSKTVQRLGNQLLGLSYFPAFGFEPSVFTPDAAVSLTNRSITENLPPTVVGQLAVQWIDSAATVVDFELVAGDGDDDNGDFAVSSLGQLSTAGSLDYEAGVIRSIRVRATLASGQLIESTLPIYVQNERDTFQNPQISSPLVAEDAAIGQLVGSISAEPIIAGDALTYQLVSVDGNTASTQFVLSGNQLLANGLLDFETVNSHTVSIRIANSSGTATEVVTFEILVENVNENATSQLVITNDRVTENNAVGESIGVLGVRNSVNPFSFALTSGPGDYDNSLFEVREGALTLNDSADYETRTSYSVRITATSGAGTVSDILTIDVLGVNEFSGNIRFIDPIGESIGYLSIDENTPVGTTVATILVVDQDRDLYELSGSGELFNRYLRIDGTQIVVANPINFEAITDLDALSLTITARSLQSGQLTARTQTASSSGTVVLPINNINDRPVVSQLGNQAVFEGEFNAFALPNPLVFDEDGDTTTIELTANGVPLPTWLSFNSDTNQLLATPLLVDVGTYLIRVTATDPFGAADSAAFVLTVQASSVFNAQGTAGDDSIVIRPANAASNLWVVIVNGTQVYRGAFDDTHFLAVDGLAGNDSISILATPDSNQFQVSSNDVFIDLARIHTANIESREIRGRGGNDSFQVIEPTVSTFSAFASNNPSQSLTSLFGGNGIDTLIADDVNNDWAISDLGKGMLNNIAFTGFENVVGGSESDRFYLEAHGRIAGEINGGGGPNSIDYAIRNGNIAVDLNLAGVATGTATSIRSFTNIQAIYSSVENRSTIRVVDSDPTVLTYWAVYDGYVSIDNLNAYGFDRLIGSDQDDYFSLRNTSQDVEIQGGGGVDYVSHEDPFSSIVVNLQQQTASGLTKFADIDGFGAATMNSEVRGVRQNTVWNVANNRVSNSQNYEFYGYGRIVGGAGRDTFLVDSRDVPNILLSGGDGKDTLQSIDPIDFQLTSYAAWQLSGPGSGTLDSLAFQNFENLEARADTSYLDFVTEVPNAVWFDSISGSANGRLFLSYRQTISGPEVVLDLKRQTVNGVRHWSNIQVFVGQVGPDRVIGRDEDVSWRLEGDYLSSDGLIEFVSFDTIVAGSGDDDFSVIGSNAGLPLQIQGGQGRNTLDFSRYSAAVVVDLQLGNTSPFALGVNSIQDLIGSPFDDYLSGNNGNNILFGFDGNDTIFGRSGNDVLMGGAGGDLLFGNAGDDILIGGSGADRLYGGAGSDLLISGSTSVLVEESAAGVNSLKRSAIQEVLNEWTSNRNYQQRTTRLRNGVGPGNSIKLNASTITSDPVVDQVFGEVGDDWFWIGMNDLATDVNAARESLTRL